MKIAYLIAAHNNPIHLKRLIVALSSESVSFFIHIDKKSSIDVFLKLKDDNVHFTNERIPVYWGDFSQVDASLIMLQTALSDKNNFDRYVLLSGVDYPIKSTSYIEKYFREHPDREFITLVSMPSESHKKSISRLTTFVIRPGGNTIVRFTKKVLKKVGFRLPDRDYKTAFANFQPYGGSSWWAFSRDASEYIVGFVAKEQLLVDFFKNTVCPDEQFFHTILGNSPYMKNAVKNVTYDDWSASGASPEIINERHLHTFKEQALNKSNEGILFARKFDEKSSEILIRIDNEIRSEN
ncbi:beta-1,6-N-acetylglucosaminyltransferase [Actimicrobium sp. CCC2.4]|uniref:beta-1,6-N-acetylglucosaminyltransferase n=1 Tax=Actimicrobium sp. CCC2.4 TaxID=3048606 RepID=UPI002AC89B7E|nr:beta-1,6-N-acetylglucosaminyltransferase [Actimicrobium sp. CCC2.4]MEB0136926.1 beta-1,6-N-acetylglucosaminyltransferase [Actimicrobium sp. CCC2.4]WPX32703.1 beta-1,6-N-acetylglucosaminyltransferase [Actimicrobium sp. CCC2.4]